MNILNYISAHIIKDQSGEELYLDSYWTCHLPSLLEYDDIFTKYYESKEHSDVDICIYGYDSPNERSFLLAIETLKNLERFYKVLDHEMQLFNEGSWWKIEAICFPEQDVWTVRYKMNFKSMACKPRKILSFHLWSEYGADIEVLFFETEERKEQAGIIAEQQTDEKVFIVVC